MAATVTAADLLEAEHAVAAQVGAAELVAPVGAGTHREVGGALPRGTEIRAPSGVVAYDPAELTITLGAGTTVAELDATLREAGQECVLDPRDSSATVGGVLSIGLSGLRRLRYGPLRDRVLEVRFASADGRLVRGGGPTVKNVTGYDMPRLLVGSFGTLGVITRVILRCQPRPQEARWHTTDTDPFATRHACFRASCVLWDGTTTRVLLEGNPDDVRREATGAALEPGGAAVLPAGPHRGRVSIGPSRLDELGRALGGLEGVRWLAEVGVGTVHVASDLEDGLAAARREAERVGGWMLREAGAPGLDGFGVVPATRELLVRVKRAFDPTDKLAPGRLPFLGRDAVVTG
jgi:glycolate dehydrogenase FAD-binding subunit